MLRLLNFIRIIRLAKVLEQSKIIREINIKKKKIEKENFLIKKSLQKLKRGSTVINNIIDEIKNTKRLSLGNPNYPKIKEDR
jgi:hypothetical protein